MKTIKADDMLEPIKTYREYDERMYEFFKMARTKSENEQTLKKIEQHLKKQFKSLKENNDTFREMIAFEIENHCNDLNDALNALNINLKKLNNEQLAIVKDESQKARANAPKWFSDLTINEILKNDDFKKFWLSGN